jgi:hypothetical protein
MEKILYRRISMIISSFNLISADDVDAINQEARINFTQRVRAWSSGELLVDSAIADKWWGPLQEDIYADLSD